MLSGSEHNTLFSKGVCPDKKCRSVIYFSSVQTTVECIYCGQRHDKNSLQDVQIPSVYEGAAKHWLRDLILTNILPKRGTDMVKVLGLSNSYCKLLSPLLTRYGMDKSTGRAKLLSDMNQGEIFDCGIFGDRAFLLEQEHISIPGYGRDITGSMIYLSETLDLITSFNEGEERLIPIHADGDGHCLVHAISRALVGRELFWHPLRCCLKKHFVENINAYKELFKDFVDENDWDSIVDECDPEFRPPDGELHGLRTIHIFGLANVLKRPIVLLDSIECMKKLGDYAALFLPGLVSPNACRGKDNSLNKPLCIAWSNYSHTHYIPLVGVKRRPLPVLPPTLMPKVWGMPQTQIYMYMEFDENGNCTISGNRMLSDAYILRLVSSMETLFFDQNNIHPSIVADAQLFLYPNNGLPGTNFSPVISKVKQAVHESRLYRCLTCNALCELRMEHDWLKAGGILYNTAFTMQKGLSPDIQYTFPMHGIICKYDPIKDELVPDARLTGLKRCTWCKDSKLHKVKSDGSVMNKNEVKLDTQNQEYLPEDDNYLAEEVCDTLLGCVPKQVNVCIEWNGKVVKDVLTLYVSKEDTLTDIVYRVASEFIQKHFPEEVNNNRLQCLIGEQILKEMKQPTVNPPQNLPSPSKSNAPSSDTKKISSDKKTTETSTDTTQDIEVDPAPKLEFVKVVTSDGRQGSLTLKGNGVSYSDLQCWIKNEFQIPIESQRIKYGFPPKEFHPPSSGSSQLLSVQHGDRIIVEIIETEESIEKRNTLDSIVKMRNSLEFLLTNASEEPRNPFQHVQEEFMWGLAKITPSLFQKYGYFYQKIIEKYGRDSTKHVYLEDYPRKTFYYNSEKDSIELCVKSYGHFPISSNIDYLIEETKRGQQMEGVSKCSLLTPKLSSLFPPHQKQSKAPTLSSNSDSGSAQNQTSASQTLIRKGPGFSVLTSPKPTNQNDNA